LTEKTPLEALISKYELKLHIDKDYPPFAKIFKEVVKDLEALKTG
jgi:hypothetical protein